MPTVTVKFPPKLNAKLEAVARHRGISKSALIREAVEQKLNGQRKRSVPTAWDLAKHLAGTLKGGPRDLSTNPKYMEGYGA